MNFQTLEYVRAIGAERSFTRAAERLHVTQQTLSAHVAGVERELGCRLFVRSTPLALTHEGQAFLAHAERMSAELVDMRREVAGNAKERSGTLRVAVAHTRGRAVLPPVIDAFCREYPNVCVTLNEGTNDELYATLADGRADLAIGVVPAAWRTAFDVSDFYDERIVLMADRGLLAKCGLEEKSLREPLAKGDFSPLASCPFVLGGPDDITGGLGLSLFARASIRPRAKAQSNNMETLLALAMRGVGACLCPENLLEVAAPAEARQNLARFQLGPEAKYKICFALPANGYRWAATEEFMRIARESVRAGEGAQTTSR